MRGRGIKPFVYFNRFTQAWHIRCIGLVLSTAFETLELAVDVAMRWGALLQHEALK